MVYLSPKKADVLGLLILLLLYDAVGGQILGNVALHKPANQTGAWGGLTADKAVDGKLYEFSGDNANCAHPDTNDTNVPAQWWVNLETDYLVYNVTIFNTLNNGGYRRLTNFEVSVGSSLTDLTVCGTEYTGTPVHGGNVIIQCDIRGRIVHFQRTEGPQIYLVTLCEVVVTGTKLIDCEKCAPGSSCDDITGCSECSPGKQLPDCMHDCLPGTYGLNCANQCGKLKCSSAVGCDRVNETCSNGCQSFWIGNYCNIEIDRTDEWSKIDFDATTNSSLTVVWQQITGLPPEQHYRYEVNYRISGGSYQVGAIVNHTGDGEKSATVGTLNYNTLYDIRVDPFRDMPDRIYGTSYPAKFAKTKCGYPEQPSGVYLLTDQTQSVFTVNWNPVTSLDSRCDSITELWVDYRLPGQHWLQQAIPNITITHLTVDPEYGGQYEVRIRVANDQNYETSSDPSTINIRGPPMPSMTTTTHPTLVTNHDVFTSVAIDATLKPTATGSGDDKNMITIPVTVSVVVVVTAVTVTVIVVVIMRNRRQKRRNEVAKSQSRNPTYMNEPDGPQDHQFELSPNRPQPHQTEGAVPPEQRTIGTEYDELDPVPTESQISPYQSKPYESLQHDQADYANDEDISTYEAIP